MSKPSGYSSRNTRGPSTSRTTKTPRTPQRSNYSWYQGTSPSSSTVPTVNTMVEPTSIKSADAVYQELFGTYTPETILNTKITEYSMTGEDFSNEPEWIRKELEKKVTNVSANVSEEDKEKIQEYSQQVVTGEAKPTTLFEEFNEPYTEARSEVAPDAIAEKINQGEEYMTPTSLSDAKMVADRVYMDTLKHHLSLEEEGSEEYAKIKEAIDFGPQDFSNPSFAYSQLGLGFNSSNYSPAIEEAARFQAATVKDYLESNNIPLYQEVDNNRVEGGRIYLNTGTALQFFEEGAPAGNKELGHSYHINSGELGSYSNYELTPPPKTDTSLMPLRQISAVASAVLSVMYPPLAPVFSGVNTLIQGGDFEDALESAGKAYLSEMTTKELNQEIGKFYEGAGVDISTLPAPVQDVILDTSRAVALGKSGTKEFEDSATGAILRNIAPDIDFEDGDFDFNTPEFIKDFGDKLYAGIKAVGDVAEEGINLAEDALRPVGDLAEEIVDLTADAFEPVVDFVDEGLDYFGETVVDPALRRSSDVLSDAEDVAKDVLSDAEDVVKAGGRVVDDTLLQPIKEFGEDAVNKAKELIDKIPDMPDLPDIDLPDIDLPNIDLPNIDLPDLPDIDLPDIDLPDMPDMPDIDLPDMPDINLPNINLPSLSLPSLSGAGSGARRPSETEKLFDKELFKYDTDIKITGGMLSSDTNLRKYG